MSEEELAKKNVDAALGRLARGRLVVSINASPDWDSEIFEASEQVQHHWKPAPDQLFNRVQQKVGLDDTPEGFDKVGMEAVIWHLEELARDAFEAEMKQRGITDGRLEQARRRLMLEKGSA